MKIENAIVVVDDDAAAWSGVSVIWMNPTLQVLVPNGSVGVDVVTYTQVTEHKATNGVFTFTSSSMILDEDGDTYSEIRVLPQGPGCVPCGRPR